MYAVTFPAGKLVDAFLLVGAVEVESTRVCAGVYFPIAHLYKFCPIRNFFPDGFCTVERAVLIYIAEFHSFPNTEIAGIRFFLSGDHLEECGFARAVRTNDTDDATGRQRERQVFEQQLISKSLGHVAGFNDRIAEPGTWRNRDGDILVAFVLLLFYHLFVGRNTRLTFGMSALGRRANPLKFSLEGFLLFVCLFFFYCKPGLFLL